MNIHRRICILLYTIAALAFTAFVILVPAKPSAGAQHASVARALTILDQINANSSRRTISAANRFVYPKGDLAPDVSNGEPKVYMAAAAGSAPQITEPVQTFDLLSPPPTFTPPTGISLASLINSTPSWTTDEEYIVFTANLSPDGHRHIWAAPATGVTSTSELIQLTQGNGDESFPVLSPTNGHIAFVSTAQTPGIDNLYTMPFNENTLGTATPVNPASLSSLTINSGSTVFSDVGRPSWSYDELQIAFSAEIQGQTSYHVFSLYVSSDGYQETPTSAINPPAQLTSGNENDSDVAWSPDGKYIAFASDATGFANTGYPFQPGSPETYPSVASGVGSTTSIFVLTNVGTVPGSLPDGKLTSSPSTDGGPAWAVANSPFDGSIAFHRLMPEISAQHGTIGSHYDIYYAPFEDVSTGNLSSEDTVSGGLQHLNTSDVNPSGSDTITNQYDDMYPTWSPDLKQISIAYQSDRTVSYNNGADPSETAISSQPGGYQGILISELKNINPPTLLRFEGTEIVHVNAGTTVDMPSTSDPTGGATRFITPGTPVTFTVRLSNRESGVDPNNVYIQIKNPNSAYDDPHGLEHKEFATDNLPKALTTGDEGNDWDYVEPPPYINPYTEDPAVASHTQLYANQALYGMYINNESKYAGYWPYVGQGITEINQAIYLNRGAVAGASDATDDFSIGNSSGSYTAANYRSWGAEYEYQALDPLYYASNRAAPDPTHPNPSHLDALVSDYYRPYYLAGFDDAQPGTAPDPTGSVQGIGAANRTGGARNKPITWLKLTKAATQDENGGTLYTASWLAPSSGTDFYLDVIAYDNAKNWRIFDNVWGFTTQQWAGHNDILVVSDYTSGQKFSASTYNGFGNLRPTMYGDESYYTGILTSDLPDTVYIWKVPTGGGGPVPTLYPLNNAPGYDLNHAILNTLGQGSYTDPTIEPTIGADSDAVSQRYDIWRTLARGPVDASVLDSYAPQQVTEPAIPGTKQAAATFYDAHRCVVWAEPFTSHDLLMGPGTFDSPTTQQEIANFLQIGGRLFVSGQDIGSTITEDGLINNTVPPASTTANPLDFLPLWLGAEWDGQTTYQSILTGATESNGNGRISYDAAFNVDPFGFAMNYIEATATGIAYSPPESTNEYLTNALNYYTVKNPPYQEQERTDGSMVQLTTDGSASVAFGNMANVGANSINASYDLITAVSPPLATSHTDYSLAAGGLGEPGGNVLTYYEDATTGARVVYSTFDLGALGSEVYKISVQNADFYYPHNLRAEVMHNIVSYLRSGYITGKISTPTGQGVAGATVIAQANSEGAKTSPAIPGMPAGRTEYSATTAADGSFTIAGVETGSYVISAVATGYATATSTIGIFVEGDNTTSESLVMNPEGGTITGTVTNQSDGTTVENASVSFTAPGVTLSATTNESGVYTIQDVPGGAYTGVATKGTAESASANVTVINGETTTQNFTLPTAPAQISGTVSDTNGPISGATVTATPQSGSSITTTTNSSGQYTLTGVQAGSWAITASASGHLPSTQNLNVTNGSLLTLNFKLTIGTASTLYGIVEGSALKTPIAGITVNIENSSGTVVASVVSASSTSAAPDGSGNLENFQVGLAAGTYTLVPSVTGAASVVVAVSGAYTQQNVPIPTGVIGGVISNATTGSPVGGVTVTIKSGSTTIGNPLTTTPQLTTVTGAPEQVNYYAEIAPGTSYTVTVTPPAPYIAPATKTVAVTENQWTEYNVALQVNSIHTFGPGVYMLSTPYNYQSLGWDGLFGTTTGAQSNRSHAFIWSPIDLSYISDPNTPADYPHLGLGYWLKINQAVNITQAGTAATTSTVSVQLYPGWNMIGVPSTTALDINSVTFADPAGSSTPISFADASSSLYDLVNPLLYYYDPESGYVSVTAGGQLQPWYGYWIQANQNCVIEIPTSAS